MPELTRRRSTDAREECWHIYYGDVHAGTIARRVGNPFDTDPWEWSCGFFSGSHPRECTHGTSATFDQARADFERAWAVFLPKRTEADFSDVAAIAKADRNCRKPRYAELACFALKLLISKKRSDLTPFTNVDQRRKVA
jgi:hypothetical protein